MLASSQVLEASGSMEPSIFLVIDDEPTSKRHERRMRSILSVLSSNRTAANTDNSFRAYKIGKYKFKEYHRARIVIKVYWCYKISCSRKF